MHPAFSVAPYGCSTCIVAGFCAFPVSVTFAAGAATRVIPFPLMPRCFQYLFGRRLGVGRLGEVRHAIQRSDGESVAVKCVKRNRHSSHEVGYLLLGVLCFGIGWTSTPSGSVNPTFLRDQRQISSPGWLFL